MSSIQRYTEIFSGSIEPSNQGAWVLYSDHAALLAAKDEEIGRLKDVILEALEPGVFGPWHTTIDPAFGPEIETLCESIGYGALMHHVEALWKRKAERVGVPGSEHTCAACASVRHSWINAARQALKESPHA